MGWHFAFVVGGWVTGGGRMVNELLWRRVFQSKIVPATLAQRRCVLEIAQLAETVLSLESEKPLSLQDLVGIAVSAGYLAGVQYAQEGRNQDE